MCPLSVGALSDSVEFGRRLAAARGYRREHRPAFAKRIGTTDTTLAKWEKGEFSANYRTVEQRRQLAERVIEASGCPPGWFELSELPTDAAEQIRQELDGLRVALQQLAVSALDADEMDEWKRWLPTDRRSEEQEPGEASG